jgi:predicted peptidase
MNQRTTLSVAASLALIVLFGSLALPAVGGVETGFINGKVQANGKALLYVVYVPRDYSPDKQWPVILYLHGGSADGTDGFHQVFLYGIGLQLWQFPKRCPFLVVMPQHPNRPGWNGDWNHLALQALEEVVTKYGGDRTRLYLTGISLGGQGTWQLAADHPDLFAAAMPIASTSISLKIAPALKSLPLWVFHSGGDTVASPKSDRALVAAIQAEGNLKVQYTEYAGTDHDVSQVTYGNPKVIEWLLAQKR